MIKKIKLQNFRRFKQLEIETTSNLIILTGKNAIGKTTILEAIYLASTSKSNRSTDYKEMIRHDSPFSKINIISDDNIEVILSEKGKKTSINHLEIKKISDFIGTIKVVMFSPQDLLLVTGEKSLRRNYFDLSISLISKDYIKKITAFKKILKNRNEILKSNKIDKILLDVITRELCEVSSEIISSRKKYINILNEELSNIKGFLGADENISINYIPSIDGDFYEFYTNHLEQDISSKITNYGIHRDDYQFLINSFKAKGYASQGQMRSVCLSLKIACANLIKKITKKAPVLLLDDVFSELDLKRQTNLVQFLFSFDQTFITTTNLNGIPKELLNKSHIVNLKEELK